MKNNMKCKTLVVSLIFLIVLLLNVGTASALITGTSSSSNEPLKNYAYVTQSNATSSLSSQGNFISGDATKSGLVFLVLILIGLAEITIADQIAHNSKRNASLLL